MGGYNTLYNLFYEYIALTTDELTECLLSGYVQDYIPAGLGLEPPGLFIITTSTYSRDEKQSCLLDFVLRNEIFAAKIVLLLNLATWL